MARQAITTDRIAKPVGPFSPAVRDGDTLYLSGQVAQDPATGKLISGDVAAQTERIFCNIEALLHAAQLSLDHVIRARTTVAAAGLPLGAMVELEVVAR